MKLFYIPQAHNGICVIDKTPEIITRKGSGKTADKDFIVSGKIEGIGDIVMEWIDRDIQNGNKSKYGKSCVLTVENFKASEIKESDPENRVWFCKGNFTEYKKNSTNPNPNYDPDNPIVVSNGLGKNRQQTNKVEYKNAKFSLAVNNAISKEKQAGATTILRVFEN